MCLVGNGFKFVYSFSISSIHVLHILDSIHTETLNLFARSGRKWPIYTINRQTETWYIKDNILHSVVNFNCLQTTHFEGWLWPENLIDCYITVWRTTWPQNAANWPQLDSKSTLYWRHSRRHRKPVVEIKCPSRAEDITVQELVAGPD